MRDGQVNLLSGLCSGTSAALVGAPLDTIRVRLQNGQSGYRSTWHCASDTVRRAGVRGLWAGCTPQIVSLSVLQSVGFTGFGVAIRWIEGRPTADTRELWRTAPASSLIIAGALSGIPITFVQTPLDRVKTLLQANVGAAGVKKSARDWATELSAVPWRHGWPAGFWVTYCRSLLAGGSFFLLFDRTVAALKNAGVPDAPSRFISGGISGVTVWLIVCPLDASVLPQNEDSSIENDDSSTEKYDFPLKSLCFDSMKSFQQSISPGAAQSARTWRHAYSNLRRVHGPFWGWVGISPIVARAFLVNSVTMTVYTTASDEIREMFP